MELTKVEIQEDVGVMKDTITRLNSRLQAMESYIAGKFGDVAVSEFNQNFEKERNVFSLIPAGEYVTVQIAPSGSQGFTTGNFITTGGQTLKPSANNKNSFEIHLQDDLIFPITAIPSNSYSTSTVSLSDIAQVATVTTIPDTKSLTVASSRNLGKGKSIVLESEKKHECQTCFKRYKRKDHLKDHMRSHSATATTTHIIPVQINAQGHAQIVPSSDPERKHACPICHKTYKRRGHVNQHIKLAHTDDKKFKCVRCDKAFGQNSMLVQHLKRCQETLKKFSCEYCEKKFLTNPELTKHKRTHTGEKPFACPICGKSFAIKSNVDTHMRVHTGVKPVSCPICGRGFSRKEVVEKHMRVHTTEKKFQCKDCTEVFLRKYHLTCHWNQAHKVKYTFTDEELYGEGEEGDPSENQTHEILTEIIAPHSPAPTLENASSE